MDPQSPAGHGIRIEFDGDWVDFVDTWAHGEPRVRFTRHEFEAFVEGICGGQFDDLPPPRQGDAG